jgi:hypothetical protein
LRIAGVAIARQNTVSLLHSQYAFRSYR